MLSLVWKDLVAGRRTFLVVMGFGVLQLAVAGSAGMIFLPSAFLFAGVFAFSPIFLDEFQRTEPLWNSLPVGRGTVVAARYLAALLGILAGLALSWVVGQAVTRFLGSGVGGPTGSGDLAGAPGAGGGVLLANLSALAPLFVALALAAAFVLPFYFRWGLRRGLFIAAAVSVGLSLVAFALLQLLLTAYGLATPFPDLESWQQLSTGSHAELAAWLESRIGWILGGLAALSVAAMALSAALSTFLYGLRDL